MQSSSDFTPRQARPEPGVASRPGLLGALVAEQGAPGVNEHLHLVQASPDATDGAIKALHERGFEEAAAR
jgi:hypothetical protein